MSLWVCALPAWVFTPDMSGRPIPRFGGVGNFRRPVTSLFITIKEIIVLTVCHSGSSLTSCQVPDDK